MRNWSRNATNLIIASQRLKNELKTYMCFLNPFQTRNRFEGTRSEVEELMNKIRQNPKDHKRASQFTAEGYLYVQEKSKRLPRGE